MTNGAAAVTHATTTEPRPRSRRRAVVLAALTLIGAAIVLAAVMIRVSGGNWFIVESPSMGETAPVGTLVITEPLGDSALRVGDVITFHPPIAPRLTYTHRIAQIDAEGRIATRGDINGAEDGWRITRADIVGRVAVILPGVGWLIKALPVLLGGTAIVWWLTGLVARRERRFGLRFTGMALVLTAALAWLKPLFGATALQVTSEQHVVHATVVATGLLPVRVIGTDGSFTDLVSGQVGTLTSRVPSSGRYGFDIALHLPWYGWLAVAAVCIAPTVASLVLGRKVVDPAP